MTDEHRALLAAELQSARYDGLTAAAAHVKLHASQETVAAVVPKPLTITGLLGLLSPQSLGKITDWVHLLDFRSLVLAQDRVGVGMYAAMLLASGKVTSEEYAAVMAELSATVEVETVTGVVPRITTAFAGVDGFPNAVDRESFDAAWVAAGRSL